MAVEIGSLVVRGTFGQSEEGNAATAEQVNVELARFRQQLLREVRDMLDATNRQAKDR